jgi:cyclopropane fatty-acyl-phospholipid synthase-like methyltransferase
MTAHWNHVYASREVDALSWSEPEPTTSLELLDELAITPDDAVLDIGAGESLLADRLAARGYHDLTILDLSAIALGVTLARVDPHVVTAIEADVTTWRPARRYDVWHDRAVLHFIGPPRVRDYVETMHSALSPGAKVVIGVFAPDGPTTCSGLEVTRYDADDITQLLGNGFDIVAQRRTQRVTPWGAEQSFQWVAAVRKGRASTLSTPRRNDD